MSNKKGDISMYFKDFNLKRTATKFDNKDDAYSYWQNNGGYLLVLSDSEDILYVVEDNKENYAYQEFKEEFSEVTIAQVVSDEKIEIADCSITEQEFWDEEELCEGMI